MAPQAAVASVTALHRPVVVAAPWPSRRPARTPLAVARGRRKKEESQLEELAADWKDLEVSPALAAQTDDLVQMLPDPANPPESLLDENFDSSYFSGAYSSGSEFDWQQTGDADWLMSDLFDGGSGLAPGGGGAAGSTAPGSDFFELRSADWADSLASEVGEGSSFRRDQRERYAPPLGGANLAHVAEEELLTPEQLTLRTERIEGVMDAAMTLHHRYMENAVNKYAVCLRMGELIEEVEYDDWSAPLEAADATLPAWCRAAALMEGEYEELQARAAEADAVSSAAEEALFVEEIDQLLALTAPDEADSLEDQDELGPGAAADPLEELLRVPLPGEEVRSVEDDEGDEGEADRLAAELLGSASAAAEKDFQSLLSGDGLDGLAGLSTAAELEEDEESEEDDEEEEEEASSGDDSDGEARARGGARRGRKRSGSAAAGPPPEADPLLDLFGEDDF